MAEGSEEAGGNWWGGWVKTVQEKSGHAWEQMRKDLGEFGSTIQKDTAQAAASTATLIREQLKVPEGEEEDVTTSARMKVGFSNLLTGLSQSLTPAEGDALKDDHIPVAHRDPHIFDKVQARRHAMQTDPTTYCSDPDGHPEFREWLETFDVDSQKGEISELLVINTEVRALYTKLVPAAVSHLEFWGRYFYRIQQLTQDEERRKALKERAEMTSSQKFEEEDLGWGDEEETWDTMPDAAHDQPESQKFVVLPEGSEDGAPQSETEGRIPKQQAETKASDSTMSEAPSGPMNDSTQDLPKQSTPSMESRNLEQCQRVQSTEQEQACEGASSSNLDSAASPPQTARKLESDKKQVSEKSEVQSTTIGHPSQQQTTDSHPMSSTPDNVPSGASVTPSKDIAIATDSSNVRADGKVSSDSQFMEEVGPTLDKLSIETDEIQEGSTEGADKVSPVASEGSNRESSLSDDWEKDFDEIEVTEEDLKNASVKLTTGADDELDDDWESWE